MTRMILAILNFTISSAIVIGLGMMLEGATIARVEDQPLILIILGILWLSLLFVGFKASQQLLKRGGKRHEQ